MSLPRALARSAELVMCLAALVSLGHRLRTSHMNATKELLCRRHRSRCHHTLTLRAVLADGQQTNNVLQRADRHELRTHTAQRGISEALIGINIRSKSPARAIACVSPASRWLQLQFSVDYGVTPALLCAPKRCRYCSLCRSWIRARPNGCARFRKDRTRPSLSINP